MNKSLILFAGLALGTAAFAQETPSTMPAGPESSTSVTDTAPSAVPEAAAPAAADATTSAPDSNAAAPRATFSSTMPQATPADTANYPRCSAGMTDKCVQREGRRARR